MDTAGAGKYRGAPGVKYKIQFYGPDPSIVMFGDGMKIAPYGIEGGKAGSLNRNQLSTKKNGSESLESKSPPRALQSGDTLTLLSSGGGGWGNPHERDPQMVYDDYKNGYISLETALKEYGVAVTTEGINWNETKK